MSFELDRKRYSDMFGPTEGDSIRLGDTDLFLRIEKDYTVYGEESKFGGGKTLRDGMGVNPLESRKNPDIVDTIINSVVVIDYTGIYKADIGIKDGKIHAIGKGGNPTVMQNVDFLVGASTESIAGEGMILTAGGIDSHVHIMTPGLVEAASDNGITTLVGGGTGPATGTCSATCSPGEFHIQSMMKAFEGLPINIGIYGKGLGANELVTAEQIEAGACGLKVHEDWGATPSGIDYSLRTADLYDIQVAVHTDTLNESGFVENTIERIAGRTIHTFHTEGAGGGHAPDIIVVAGHLNCLPSSTSPTNPFTSNTIPETKDMLMVCHHLDPKIPEDVAFADSRIRKQTIGAEDVLQDLGAISMMSSDCMAMGRVGEVVMRTWQLADKCKKQLGSLAGDSKYNDNNRIKRYVAKYTINPAITCGMDEYIGSVEVGKHADLVLWSPQMFGTKPDMIIKSGMISYGVMGDANASIPPSQPKLMRHLFGSYGKGLSSTNLTFVSSYAYDHGIKEKLDLDRVVLPVKNTRNLTKRNMKLNDALPVITVDPQTFDVYADGKLVYLDPADTLPLTQRYYMF